MSLEGVQEFITRYLREPEFRERCRQDMAAAARECRVEESELAELKGLGAQDFDNAAEEMFRDRIGKRSDEFRQFVDHLALYYPIEQFYRDYDATHPGGQLARPLELNRFLDFGVKQVLSRQLPDYLLDLLRFCYGYTSLADAPLESSPATAIKVSADTELRAHQRVALRRPYRIVEFRYDILTLASHDPALGPPQVIPAPGHYLMQKHWEQAKTTRVVPVDELPLLARLQGETPVALIDLVAWAPNAEIPGLVSHLQQLAINGYLDLFESP